MTPEGDAPCCAPPSRYELEFFDSFVTMANSDHLIARNHQVSIHQSRQSTYDDVTGIRSDQPDTFLPK